MIKVLVDGPRTPAHFCRCCWMKAWHDAGEVDAQLLRATCSIGCARARPFWMSSASGGAAVRRHAARAFTVAGIVGYSFQILSLQSGADALKPVAANDRSRCAPPGCRDRNSARARAVVVGRSTGYTGGAVPTRGGLVMSLSG